MATTSSSAGVIQVGGLATGLDTNSIITQLVGLEQHPITVLQQQQSDVEATQASFATLRAKLSALQSASDALNTLGEVLVGTASSSNESVVTAAVGDGAARGTVTIDVAQLARGSVAGASTGVGSATSTIATGDGLFSFQVGSGEVQKVNVTATTTLQDLASAINGLGAGVVASAINLGTDASPDYRLNLVSRATGASSTITVLQDDTSLAVQTTQSGQNARFTVSGFSGTFERESNTFSDVLTGVTFGLRDQGTATISVEDNPDAITTKVQTLVSAFNDVIDFVAGQSTVQQGSSNDTLDVGPLAVNSTVRGLIDELHSAFSATLGGATTQYVNLSSVGFATQKDGTIAFDETRFRTALADDSTAVGQLFAGNDAGGGVANGLSKLVADVAGIGGALSIDEQGFTDQIAELQNEIDDGQRRVDQFKADLQQQFTALETLVSGLQSQQSFLTSALSSGGGKLA